MTKSVPVKRLSKRFQIEPEMVELGLEAMQYLILHIAKMNAVVNPNDFEALYSQTGLNKTFQLNFYNVLKGHIDDLRRILENDITFGVHRLKDVDWRLSMVTGSRQKQKMMVPKYTMKLSLE